LHRELRLAVVAAGLIGSGTLLRDAAVALQQQRLRRIALQLEREAGAVADDAGGVAAARQLTILRRAAQLPVAQADVGVVVSRTRDAEAAARDALVVAQATLLEVGQRCVREQQLRRLEAAARCAGDAGGGAKERDLKSPALRGGIEAPGQVPPFGARERVRPEIDREAQRRTRLIQCARL